MTFDYAMAYMVLVVSVMIALAYLTSERSRAIQSALRPLRVRAARPHRLGRSRLFDVVIPALIIAGLLGLAVALYAMAFGDMRVWAWI